MNAKGKDTVAITPSPLFIMAQLHQACTLELQFVILRVDLHTLSCAVFAFLTLRFFQVFGLLSMPLTSVLISIYHTLIPLRCRQKLLQICSSSPGISTCAGAIDGILIWIFKPSLKEAKASGVDQKNFCVVASISLA